jgi:hypothetical protein
MISLGRGLPRMQVAIKWIQPRGSESSGAANCGFTPEQRMRALHSEWSTLNCLSKSLTDPNFADVDRNYPPTPPNVVLENTNVVVGLSLVGNGITLSVLRQLSGRDTPPLDQVLVLSSRRASSNPPLHKQV